MSRLAKISTQQGASQAKNLTANAEITRHTDSIPESGRSLGGGYGTPLLPGESHRQRSLAGYRPWGHTESHMTEHLSKHSHSTQQVQRDESLWTNTITIQY